MPDGVRSPNRDIPLFRLSLEALLKASAETQEKGIHYRGMILMEELVGEEWAEWYRLTPLERWRESEKLWQSYLYLGGSLDTNPILRVLSLISAHRVRALLMGGQACVFYGAAEFSREADRQYWRPLKAELESLFATRGFRGERCGYPPPLLPIR